MGRAALDRRDRLGRPLPDGVYVVVRRDVVAECLWELGEDALAAQVLELSDADLVALHDLAVWHRHNDVDPPGGPRVSNALVLARAAIDLLEGSGRDTVRRRRRTRPPELQYTAALLAGVAAPDTPAERGER